MSYYDNFNELDSSIRKGTLTYVNSNTADDEITLTFNGVNIELNEDIVFNVDTEKLEEIINEKESELKQAEEVKTQAEEAKTQAAEEAKKQAEAAAAEAAEAAAADEETELLETELLERRKKEARLKQEAELLQARLQKEAGLLETRLQEAINRETILEKVLANLKNIMDNADGSPHTLTLTLTTGVQFKYEEGVYQRKYDDLDNTFYMNFDDYIMNISAGLDCINDNTYYLKNYPVTIEYYPQYNVPDDISYDPETQKGKFVSISGDLDKVSQLPEEIIPEGTGTKLEEYNINNQIESVSSLKELGELKKSYTDGEITQEKLKKNLHIDFILFEYFKMTPEEKEKAKKEEADAKKADAKKAETAKKFGAMWMSKVKTKKEKAAEAAANAHVNETTANAKAAANANANEPAAAPKDFITLYDSGAKIDPYKTPLMYCPFMCYNDISNISIEPTKSPICLKINKDNDIIGLKGGSRIFTKKQRKLKKKITKKNLTGGAHISYDQVDENYPIILDFDDKYEGIEDFITRLNVEGVKNNKLKIGILSNGFKIFFGDQNEFTFTDYLENKILNYPLDSLKGKYILRIHPHQYNESSMKGLNIIIKNGNELKLTGGNITGPLCPRMGYIVEKPFYSIECSVQLTDAIFNGKNMLGLKLKMCPLIYEPGTSMKSKIEDLYNPVSTGQ